jgi:transcriptional regulator with XRE-family HTH domain
VSDVAFANVLCWFFFDIKVIIYLIWGGGIIMALSDNFKKLRIKYHLTQQELAEIAGVTNKAISAWESGLSEPRMGAIEKIARHFHIKKSNIIEEDGIEHISPDRRSK